MKKLTQELFQKHENNDGTLRVEVLYNNRYDYFYFNLFQNDILIQGDTRIVNEYENEHLNFYSRNSDFASFESANTFELRFLND